MIEHQLLTYIQGHLFEQFICDRGISLFPSHVHNCCHFFDGDVMRGGVGHLTEEIREECCSLCCYISVWMAGVGVIHYSVSLVLCTYVVMFLVSGG